MLIDVCNRLVDNALTRDELIPYIRVESMSYDDAPKITELMGKCFSLPREEALRQLLYSDALLDKSVKLIDRRNGDIYGFLIFSNFSINVGSPINYVRREMAYFLSFFNQVNGFSFIIDERLRGCGFDRKMLLYGHDFLRRYEMVWAAVEKDFKTHSYWKRLGFTELFSIPEATFYGLFNEKYVTDDIYRIIDTLKNEDDYH